MKFLFVSFGGDMLHKLQSIAANPVSFWGLTITFSIISSPLIVLPRTTTTSHRYVCQLSNKLS